LVNNTLGNYSPHKW